MGEIPRQINSVRLTEEGRQTLAQIRQMYQDGVDVEQIAERLKMKIEHIQFLTTLEAVTEKKA